MTLHENRVKSQNTTVAASSLGQCSKTGFIIMVTVTEYKQRTRGGLTWMFQGHSNVKGL